jgi:Family of unknown function (DUF6444)
LDELAAANLTLTADNARLRARLGMNSKNSSKPPSSDGYTKPAPKSRRCRSGKKPGKQPGAPGKNLAPVVDPDEIVNHSPDHCEGCGDDLTDAPITGEVRRQVFGLPPVKMRTVEHRVERPMPIRLLRCGPFSLKLVHGSGPSILKPGALPSLPPPVRQMALVNALGIRSRDEDEPASEDSDD